MITIEIHGLKEFQGNIKKAKKDLIAGISKGIRIATGLLEAESVKEAPADQGWLRKNIKSRIRPLSSEIFPTVDYAIFVHEGTRPHIITAKNKKVIAFKPRPGQRMKGWMRKNKRGFVILGKRVNHPGTKANPFFTRAVKKNIRGVERIFEKILDRAIKILAK